GIGALLLSRTTPEIVVSAGLPGARPDAMKPAAKLWLDGKFAWTKLFALPSCVLTLSTDGATQVAGVTAAVIVGGVVSLADMTISTESDVPGRPRSSTSISFAPARSVI